MEVVHLTIRFRSGIFNEYGEIEYAMEEYGHTFEEVVRDEVASTFEFMGYDVEVELN